jgi:hypothetical protein
VRRIEQAIADRASQDAVGELRRGLAARITAATGVALQPLPPSAPSVERGATLFRELRDLSRPRRAWRRRRNRVAWSLTPASFTDVAFMQAETRTSFFNVVTLAGVARHAGLG